MAKAAKLIDELKTIAPFPRSGPLAWHEKLAIDNPKLKEEIDEIIDLFHKNDHRVVRVCHSKETLARYLAPKVGRRDTKSVVTYINSRNDGRS